MPHQATCLEALPFSFTCKLGLKGVSQVSCTQTSHASNGLAQRSHCQCIMSKNCTFVQCAGLRLIPGATKSGLQKEKTPERKLLEFFTGGGDKKEE